MPGMKNPLAGKGSLRHSQKVRSATTSAASHDVSNFDRGGADPIKVIASYQRLGEALRKSHSFRKVAEQIAQIAEMAESTVTEEGNDWFDQHTIKRNMKELKSYAGDFGKIAEQLDTLHQRAAALYDDMGNVLSRYFEVVEPKMDDNEKFLTEPDDEPFGGEKAPEFDGPGGNPADDTGRHAWDMRDGEEDDEVEEQAHAPYIRTHGYDPRGPGAKKAKPKKESAVPMTAPHAHRAMRTPAAMSRPHAGMSRAQAKAVLRKEGAKSVKEAKRAITKEHLRRITKESRRPFSKR